MVGAVILTFKMVLCNTMKMDYKNTKTIFFISDMKSIYSSDRSKASPKGEQVVFDIKWASIDN